MITAKKIAEQIHEPLQHSGGVVERSKDEQEHNIITLTIPPVAGSELRNVYRITVELVDVLWDKK